MTEQPEKDTKDKEPGLLKRICAAPKAWTAATWATILVTVFLVVTVMICWSLFRFGYDHVPWRHYMTWPRLFGLLLLLVAIPVVFHRGIKLWLEGESARFPEVQKAWQAGMSALREHGISLDSTPLFLVVGSNCELQEKSIMNANETPLSVVGIPKGPSPLHWYANSEAIYLFCSDASWLSTLNRLRKAAKDEASQLAVGNDGMPDDVIENSEPLAVEAVSTPTGPPSAGLAPTGANASRGTIMLDQFVDPGASSSAPSARGTIVLDEAVKAPVQSAASAARLTATAPVAAGPTPAKRQAVTVSPRDSSIRLQRLQNVSQLVKQARQPFCPVNGILTLLPFATIDATASELDELQRAIRADLKIIHEGTQLRTPVTALVFGLEDEAGFRELVRRVGREKSASQRFGGRFDVRSDATIENLRAFSTHVCGAFEDWVYTLFRERGALSRPGNPRLYSLLCKVRCILKGRLGNILANGFGYDDKKANTSDSRLFSGCYFASTGRTADRQAFVRGVLNKLVAEQEQIEWSDKAISQNQRYSKLLLVGIAIDVFLVLLLCGLFY